MFTVWTVLRYEPVESSLHRMLPGSIGCHVRQSLPGLLYIQTTRSTLNRDRCVAITSVFICCLTWAKIDVHRIQCACVINEIGQTTQLLQLQYNITTQLAQRCCTINRRSVHYRQLQSTRSVSPKSTQQILSNSRSRIAFMDIKSLWIDGHQSR